MTRRAVGIELISRDAGGAEKDAAFEVGEPLHDVIQRLRGDRSKRGVVAGSAGTGSGAHLAHLLNLPCAMQRRRAAQAAEPPPGLTYRQDFLSVDEERDLLAEIETYPFHEVRMRGQVARRTVIHFGWDYDYDGWSVHPTTPPSPQLRALADRCAEIARIAKESLEQFLVARYPAGATIGWHRDAPMFGSPVIGVSLASSCTMKFRRAQGEGFEQFVQLLEPRSLYLLDGAARTQWQHSIPPTKELRYSISMRTLKKQPRT